MSESTRRMGQRAQSGYMLLAILIMMTLLIIAATAVAPSVATQIKREREQELIHRGTDYARAIRRYYRKFGRYPVKVEDLENTNNMRFLRKRWKDPVTGKDEWRLIHFGEAKTGLNLFGPIGDATSGAGSGGSGVKASPGSALGVSNSGPGGTTAPGASGPGSGPGTGTGTNRGGAGGSGNQTFGGGPIIGVASLSENEALIELDGNTHYNEWEFVYDPRFDTQAAGAQQPGVGTGTGNKTPGGEPSPPGNRGPGSGGPIPPPRPPG